MITFFTSPKIHKDKSKIHQLNSFKSLMNLDLKIELIIFDDLKQFTGKEDIFSVKQIKIINDFQKNEFGTPFINDIFNIAIDKSNNDVLVYFNSDIIFNKTIEIAIQNLLKEVERNFLGVGKRIDIKLDEIINKYDKEAILKKTNNDYSYHNKWGIDYFIFNKNTFIPIPKFLIGRTCWDNWIISSMKKNNFKIIDCTSSIECFHPFHDYSHIKSKNEKSHHKGVERDYNLKICGGYKNLFNINDCDYYLNNNKIKKKKFTQLILFYETFLRRIFYPLLNIFTRLKNSF